MNRLERALRKAAKGTIGYVGGQCAGRAGTTSTASISFALTNGLDSVPKAGDLVVITCVVGTQGRTPAQAVTTGGYTALGLVYNSLDTYDAILDVSYKVIGSVPDTTFLLPATGDAADAQRYAVQVFRGVDKTTPLDVTPTNATGIDTSRCNPASITPVTPGACILVCGGGAAATGANYTGPSGFTTNFLTGFTADTNDALIGCGYMLEWKSGAVDPAAYTGGSNTTSDSWAAYTIALRPAS